MTSRYKSYDELPPMLSAPEIVAVLGISRNDAIQAIESLIQKRLIDKIPTTRRNVHGHARTSNNEYRIHDLSALDPGA